MERREYNQSEKYIQKRQAQQDEAWDMFIYGDKENNIKPGSIIAYNKMSKCRRCVAMGNLIKDIVAPEHEVDLDLE